MSSSWVHSTLLICLLLLSQLQQITTLSFSALVTNLEVFVDFNDSIVTITFTQTGDSNWMAVGFGDQVMKDTYAIVYGIPYGGSTKQVFEVILGQSPDYIGDSGDIRSCDDDYCAYLLSSTTINDTNEVIITRYSDVNDSASFEFSTDLTLIDYILANGNQEMFDNYHDDRSFGEVSLSSTNASSTTSSTSTSSSTTSTSIANEEYSGPKILSKTLLGLDISLAINLTEYSIEFMIYGPADKWFALAWINPNDNIDSFHTIADVLMYCTGWDDDQDLSLYDGHLRIKSISESIASNYNNFDETQNWEILESETIDDEVMFHVRRDLISNDTEYDRNFSYSQNSIQFFISHCATADSHELAYHSLKKAAVSINLESGTVSEIILSGSNLYHSSEHGLFMFFAFGVCIPLGFMLNQHRLLFNLPLYLSVQLHRTAFAIAGILIGVGLVTQLAQFNGFRFIEYHSGMGLCLIIIYFSGLVVAYFKQRFGKLSPFLMIIVSVFYMVYGWVQILSGIWLEVGEDNSVVALLFVVWMFIIVLMNVIFLVYIRGKRASMEEQTAELIVLGE